MRTASKARAVRLCIAPFLLSAYVESSRAAAAPDWVTEALSGPLRGIEEVVFANRGSYSDGHWYANIGYYCNDERQKAYAGNGKPDVGRLCKLNLRSGKVTVLVDAKGGSIRDPVVHYDGRRVLFAWREAGEEVYHLWEIDGDGKGLRQVTDGEYDDYEPTYLPDDDIVFVSTRCRRWVNCWKTQVGTLYRLYRRSSRIEPLSANLEHDNTPAVLPDGRLLYTRWEYVDRSQIGYHHLWVINPDGTGQMTFYGNQRHYPLYIGALPLPGTDRVVAIEAPGHGRRDHYGYVIEIDPNFGPDDDRGIRRISQGRQMYTDPYPLTDRLFLVAQGNAILLMNDRGQTHLLHRSDRRCFEPRPLAPRTRERIIPARAGSAEQPTGRLILLDAHRGRNMGGVRKGDVKKLLVLESLPKPVSFSGGPDLVSWLGTFTLERAVGTVPVEADGSAYFELPAHRAFFFVELDENDLSVKRMQSFVSVMPGETTTCVGCHERRSSTPASVRAPAPLATQRPPSRVQPFEGLPDVIDFHRDIQPILDRHCVSCHSFQRPEGDLVLEGDLGPVYALSWYALFARNQIADGRNGFGNQPPRTIGTSASRLMQKIDGSHYGASLSPTEWRTVWLWIETGATYVGSYAALRNEAEMRLGGWGYAVFAQQRAILARRCGVCHGKQGLPPVPFSEPPWPKTRGIKRPLARHERRVIDNDPLARFSPHVLVNMSRPQLSPLLLAPLAKKSGGWEKCGAVFANSADADYLKLLQSLQYNKRRRDAIPRYATPGYRPNAQYVREMKRFGILPASLDPSRDQVDWFATDRAYWRALW